jgi:hypothetical protein
MLVPYAFIFHVPALASLALLVMLWNMDALLGRSAAIFGIWFLVALVMQYSGRGVWLWLTGLLMQTALALVLSLKWRFNS